MRGLVKRYAGRAVVDGLDLDVRPGECFALLGPNGAGQTTTVEVLAGLRRRDGGTVEVLGQDPGAGDRAWRGSTGVVGQTTGIGNALSVRETLDHFAVYHAAPEDSGVLLEAVGLTGSAGTRVDRLSGGQRRRLEVALGVQGRRGCCSSTSRPPVWTRRPGGTSGRSSRGCATAARPSS